MSSFTDSLEYSYLTFDNSRKKHVYSIDKSFRYRIGSYKYPISIITVPEKFVTDFASIPWPLSLLFKPTGKWAKAAALHDYLIQILYLDDGKKMRVFADAVFYEAMLVSGVNVFIAYTFYIFVRLWSLYCVHIKKSMR